MNDEKRLTHYRSKRISRFMSAKHYYTHVELSHLSTTDLPKLRRTVQGKVADATVGDSVKAIAAIGQYGEAKDCHTFAALVANTKADVRVRAAAAFYLGSLPSRAAEGALIRNLDVEDVTVRSKVIKSLGRIGGRRSLYALDELDVGGPPFLRRQLRLGRTMIAYRLGLDLDPMPFPQRAVRKLKHSDDLIDISFNRIRGAKVSRALERFDDPSYGIELATDLAFDISMGRARLMFFLNQEMIAKPDLARLTERRLLTGLVARRMPETKGYSVQYVVFSRPSGKGKAKLVIVRNDGLPVMSGEIGLEEGGVLFEIAEVARKEATPTRLEGTIGSKGVTLKVGLTRQRRTSKRQVKPVRLSAEGFGMAV